MTMRNRFLSGSHAGSLVMLALLLVFPSAVQSIKLDDFIKLEYDEFIQGDCLNPAMNQKRGCRCDFLRYRMKQNEDILNGRFIVPEPPQKGGGKNFLRRTASNSSSIIHGDGDDDAQQQQHRQLQSASANCVGNVATVGSTSFPCQHVNLNSWVSVAAFNNVLLPGTMQFFDDIWGWTDPNSGREFAIVGGQDKFLFVEVTNPNNPVLTGYLPSRASDWHDIKTYKNHAYMVSEASGHQMYVFSLCQLLTASPGTAFSTTAVHTIGGQGRAHNIVINEDSGFAYVVGGAHACASGLYMVNIQNPASPVFAGCFTGDGYTHDAQCVIYKGPDTTYTNREICFACNEDTLTIVDVTNKASPVILSRTFMGSATSNTDYVHQGWLTEDHRYFIVNEEMTKETTTKILNVADLNNVPSPAGQYNAVVQSTDHNNYIVKDKLYQANYMAGLRILQMGNLATGGGGLSEIGFFDTTPTRSGQGYEGMWSSYPFFPSGTIVASDIYMGLFLLTPTGATVQSTPPSLSASAAATTCPAVPTSAPTAPTPTTPAPVSAPTPGPTPPSCTCSSFSSKNSCRTCSGCSWRRGSCV